jgi:long-chain-fatty-acid--CoA ligase ACSBG
MWCVWPSPGEDLPRTRQDGTEVKIWGWKELISPTTMESMGTEAELDALAESITPQDVCALIYTAGTTGNSKAVMITHDNLLVEAVEFLEVIPGMGMVGQERVISYLPLSHVVGVLVDIFLPIFLTAKRPGYYTTYFARPYDMKAGLLGERIKVVKPTFFFGVPRVWEKFADNKFPKKQIFAWAKKNGAEFMANKQVGGTGQIPGAWPKAEKMVQTKLRAAIGLDEAKALYTGAAPIQRRTQEYLASVGLVKPRGMTMHDFQFSASPEFGRLRRPSLRSSRGARPRRG